MHRDPFALIGFTLAYAPMKVPDLPTDPISLEALQAFGVTDPQIRIYQDQAYLYASHDIDPASTKFVMPNWQLWTSKDLVHWSYESTLDPRQTHIGKPFNGCWAGDAICKDGTYYWCFSLVNQITGEHEIGLVSAPQPEGPWSDPIGGAWIAGDAADTDVYDPGFLQLDNGELYIVFGVWDYYIARVADDMSGLAETPRKVEITNPAGPYGKGKTDDKPFLHKRGNLFYLSWGCFYATSKNLYGPYDYKGCLVTEEKMETSFRAKTWPHGPQQGRHGSFFDWRGQSYFMYCDMSFSGNRYYRGSWISYVHYHENGQIAPIEITADAVGRYSADKQIPAANFNQGNGIQKEENQDGNFSISPIEKNAIVSYPNITGLTESPVTVTLVFDKANPRSTIKVSNGSSRPSKSVLIEDVTIQLKFETFDSKSGISIHFPDPAERPIQLSSLLIARA